MPQGLLIVIAGPSGAGKGTIIRKLLVSMPELAFSVSATTRPPRENEKEGKDYFFITPEEFEKRKKNGEFLEWAEVHGHFYGTPRGFVEERLAQGKNAVLDIDVQGSRRLRKIFPEGIFIFVVPPSFRELQKRLVKRRTEKAEDLKRRLADAQEELKHLKEYEYLILNDVLENAVEGVRCIIRAEQCKIPRRLQQVQDALPPG